MEFIRLSSGEIVRISALGSPILLKDSDGYVAYYEEIPEALAEGATYDDTINCLNIALNAVAQFRRKEIIKSLCLN
jgi:predicted RNase H-like HicB family nuclease